MSISRFLGSKFEATLRVGAVLLILGTLSGCAAAERRAVEYAGPVVVSVTEEPTGREMLARIEIRGQRKLEDLVRDFAARTAQLGGRLAKIDSVSTVAALETRNVTETFRCPSWSQPAPCIRSPERQVSSVTTVISGRVFR